jgi:hypothetical protein
VWAEEVLETDKTKRCRSASSIWVAKRRNSGYRAGAITWTGISKSRVISKEPAFSSRALTR